MALPRPASPALAVAGLALTTGAPAVLFADPFPGVLIGAACAAGVVWRNRRTSPRLDAEDTARALLGARVLDVWGAPVVALVLAVACVVAAVVRDDVPTGLPANPLVAWPSWSPR